MTKQKAIILSLLMLVSLAQVFGQRRQRYHRETIKNLPYVDDKLLHFGFILGLHAQDFALTPADVPDADGVTWKGDEAVLSPGFTVGIISDLRLNKYFDLRFVPALHFGERKVSFAGYKDGERISEFNATVMSTQLMFPLDIKFRSVRIGNYRPYLLAGGGVMVDISRKSDQVLMLRPLDFFFEVGVGCDIYLEYFRLCPELKICVGFNDMIERDRPNIENDADIKYTNAIDKLLSRLVVLSFNFE